MIRHRPFKLRYDFTTKIILDSLTQREEFQVGRMPMFGLRVPYVGAMDLWDGTLRKVPDCILKRYRCSKWKSNNN